MALPKIQHPTFKLTIPSNDKKITLRPFTVKEEKILLMAREAKDEDNIIDTIKQIINNCILDDIDVESLAVFDIEYIMLKLRAKSVNELVELNYKVNNETIPFEVNLENIEITRNPDHTNKFMITDDVGVCMKYPTLKIAKNKTKNMTDELFAKFVQCIDYIYDNDNVYDEFTFEEMNEFVMSLPSSALEKISEFFNTIPKLQHKVMVTDNTGKEHEVVLEGLTDFFTL